MSGPRSPLPFAAPLALAGMAAATCALAAPVKPAAPATAPAAPSATVGGYRVTVERVQENENFWLEFDGGPAKVAGRNTVSLFLAVRPPAKEKIVNIEGLDSRFIAFTPGNKPVTFQPYMPDDADPLVSGVWRTCLVASDLDIQVDGLRKIQGELLVYPQAKIVSAEFPLAAKLPKTVEVNGLKVTLKQLTTRPSVVTAVLGVEWSGPASLSRVNGDAMFGITGISKTETTILPNGGGSSSVTTKGSLTQREFKVTFLGLREPPAKLRFENVFRSGAVQKLAFSLGDMVLPDAATTPIPVTPGIPAVVEGPLQPAHPMYAATGATLVLTTVANGQMASDAEPMPVGLSRREANGWGPWRWIDVPPDGGALRVRRLLPGRYRVVLPTGGGPQEAELAAGREVRLTFDRGAEP